MNKERLLEKYFRGTLTSDEQTAFDNLLIEDAEFKEEFAYQKQLKDAIILEERAELKTYLSHIDIQKRGSGGRLRSRRILGYRSLGIAAGLAVLIGLGTYFFFDTQPNYHQLYTSHFEPYPNIIAPTVRNGDHKDDAVAQAFRYYDNKEYLNAAEAFGKIYQKSSEDYAFFYRCVSLLAQGESEEAVSLLEKRQWLTDDYTVLSHWYLGLGYLKLQDREQAIKHFTLVAESNKPIARQAKAVLKEMK